MSIERKSIHVRLSPDMHQRLGVIADFNDKDLAELASLYLEKMIAGEFHSFTVAAEKISRLGLAGKSRD